jgi:hypothetical protein
MQLETEPRFVATPAPSYAVFAHNGGVLLLPGMYGTPLAELGSAFWSETGERFVAAPIDGSAVNLSATPEVRAIFHGSVSPRGTVFVQADRHFAATLSIGPEARIAPSGFVAPQESLRMVDMIIDAKGTWWLVGYANGDEAKGRIYSSPDGATWTLAVQEKHWTLARLQAHGDRLIGLQYKQFNELTPDGLIKLGSAKAHMDHAVFTPTAIVAFGEGIISALSWGAKRTRYATCPVSKPVQMLAHRSGVLIGGNEGLFYAPDVERIEWEKVSSVNVFALVDSRCGPLVVTHQREVFALRE